MTMSYKLLEPICVKSIKKHENNTLLFDLVIQFHLNSISEYFFNISIDTVVFFLEKYTVKR